jgi:cell division cycle 2-like
MDDGEHEMGQIEEVKSFYSAARTLSSCRWADNDDREFAALETKRNASRLKNNATRKVSTDGSDRATFRSSGSDRGDREDVKMPQPSIPRQRRINMLQGCRDVDEFKCLNKINEGTYGVVFRARDKKTDEVVALKKVKMANEKDGFPMTSLREINILASLNHPSIVDLKEVVVGSSLDSIFLVMEYMEHDLKGVMETMRQPYSQSEVKCLMLQLLEGVSHLHDNWILHR